MPDSKKNWLALVNEIKIKYEVPATNSIIGPDGFIIPGYNGLKLNDKEVLKRLENLEIWDESQLVWEEIEPRVLITDLTPAPICQGNPNKPMVSIMINVAWGNEYLLELIKIFQTYDVKATFFLDGSWVNKFPKLAIKIKDAGHEIGNHAYSHPDMRLLPGEYIIQELRLANEVILKELGIKPSLFTPPSSSYNEKLVKLVNKEDMLTILNTIDTLDWKNPDSKEIINIVQTKLINGAIILIHPTELSVHSLATMLEGIKEKGLQIGTVSELLAIKRI